MMLSPPSSLTSPTTAQIFDVPTSRPTMTDDWSNMFLPVPCGFDLGRSDGAARKELGRIDAGQDGQRVHVRRDRVRADRHRLNDVAAFVEEIGDQSYAAARSKLQ